MSNECSSCCLDCLQTTPGTKPPSTDTPYALHNLLQAGTITLYVSPDVRNVICDHNHAEDEWHTFDATPVIPLLNDSRTIEFCREMGFLMQQHFLSITYRCLDNQKLILRVYLIPYDLGNVQGKLRVRKDNILNPAKRYLRNLLPRISQDFGRWRDGLSMESGKELIPGMPVRESLFLSPFLTDLNFEGFQNSFGHL